MRNKAISFLLAICLLFAIFPFSVFAQSQSIASGDLANELAWKLDSEGTLTISGNNTMWDFDLWEYFPPWWEYREQITSVVIEPGVLSIADWAFSEAVNVKTVSIPDTVVTIGKGAFSDCALETITIPKSVTTIKSWNPLGCNSLKTIFVDKDNPVYSSDEYGVLFNKDKTKLVKLPEGMDGEYVIPDGVTEIEDCNNNSLTKLTIGKNVAVFSGVHLTNLKTLVLNGGEKIFLSDIVAPKIQSIYIGANVAYISGFENLDRSVSFEASTENANYCVVNKAVYSKDKSTLYYAEGSLEGTFNVAEGTTQIYRSAFQNCDRITNIVLPETLTTVGSNAFAGCDMLETVTGAACVYGENAFNGCVNLKELPTISNGKFSEGLFANCSSLSEITIPYENTLILGNAFLNCTSLDTIRFTGHYSSIDSTAFQNVTATCYYPGNLLSWTDDTLLNYGGNLTWVAEIVNEFEDEEFTYAIPGTNATVAYSINNDNMTAVITMCNKDATGSIVIPEKINGYTVVEIHDSAFYRCVGLTGVALPDTITVIGDSAFNGCYKITSLNMPETLVIIGTEAFKQVQFSTVIIPEGVTSVGTGAFAYSGLNSVVLPDSLTYISDSMFEYSYYLHQVEFSQNMISIGANAFSNCYELHSVILPEGLISIGDSAFLACGASSTYGMYYNAHYFVSVELPSTLKTIGVGAFTMCQSLKNIVLPEGLETLSSSAFAECNNLTAINIPSTVTAIHKSTFQNCKSLKTVTFRWNAPEIDTSAFSAKVEATCYYPAGNETWTSDVFQNYGAKQLTWVTQAMDAPAGSGDNGSNDTDDGENDDNSEENSGNSGNENSSGSESGSGSGSDDSSGGNADGGSGSGIQLTLTINNVGANISGAVINTPEDGWQMGTNTFIVNCELPCAVAYSNDNGATYARLTATKTESGYIFTIENLTAQTTIAVVLLGDVNGDGKISNADTIRLRAAYAEKITLTALEQIAADINNSGTITNADVNRLKAVYAEKASLEW